MRLVASFQSTTLRLQPFLDSTDNSGGAISAYSHGKTNGNVTSGQLWTSSVSRNLYNPTMLSIAAFNWRRRNSFAIAVSCRKTVTNKVQTAWWCSLCEECLEFVADGDTRIKFRNETVEFLPLSTRLLANLDIYVMEYTKLFSHFQTTIPAYRLR